jgi:hypothetical protein
MTVKQDKFITSERKTENVIKVKIGENTIIKIL